MAAPLIGHLCDAAGTPPGRCREAAGTIDTGPVATYTAPPGRAAWRRATGWLCAGAWIERNEAMYAVIKTGGKQYRVEKDAVFRIEKLDVGAGEDVTFDQVLMVGEGADVKVGTPLVEGASVQATVLEQARGPKIIMIKKRRRKNSRRKRGHRQDLTVVRVTDIQAAG